ncbi:MAG: carboxypeptidase regulatory-like domain-containing protein [Planctomycetes bacterium]|nr:carboxypeptidase regulatory-like domain-containing protein [Planctomycetota bacterium]
MKSQKVWIIALSVALIAAVAVAFTYLGKELYRVISGPNAATAVTPPGSTGSKSPTEAGKKPAPPEKGEGRVIGIVFDSDGKPLQGANVDLLRREGVAEPVATTTTDVGGAFTFEKLGGGGYSIRTRAKGFVSRTERNVKFNDSMQIRLFRGGTVLGRVTSADDGKPLSGATVTGMSQLGENSRWEESIETGADGAYRFEATPEKILLQVKAFGYQSASLHDVQVTAGKEITQNIPLSTGLSVHGRILDAITKAPVPGAKVSYGMGFLSNSSEVETAANGEFTIGGMPSGRQMLMVSAPGYTALRQEVTLAGDRKMEEIVLELSRGSVVSGTVFGPDGAPVAGARIFSEENAFLFSKRSQPVATTDAQGKFSVTGLDPGKTFRLVAQAANYPEATSDEITTKAGEEIKDVTLRFEKGGELAGTVRDPDGKPVAGAMITVKEKPEDANANSNPNPNPNEPDELFNAKHVTAGRQLGNATTDGDGRFAIGGLISGPKIVEVKADGFLLARNESVAVEAGKKTDNVDFTLDRGKTIAGHVTDSTGAAVGGVRVSGSSPGAANGMASYGTTTTDAEGKYRIEKLQPGKFMLTAAKQGYSADRKREIDAGSESVDFVLRRNGSISGTVTFPSAAGPRNFTVTARGVVDPSNPDEPGRSKSRSFTAEDGRFKLDDVPAGVYSVQVNSKNFAPASVDNVAVTEGQETSGIQITIHEGGTIDGFVQDRAGTGIARASVSSQPMFEDPASTLGQAGPSVITDKTGYYKISGLPEGQYEVFATAPKYTLGATQQVVASEGKPARANFTLATGASLTVVVLSPSGEAIPGAKVEVTDEKGKPAYPPRIAYALVRYQKNPKVLQSFMEKFNLTDPNGRVPLENIPEGNYKITVTKDGAATTTSIKLVDGENKEETISLKA